MSQPSTNNRYQALTVWRKRLPCLMVGDALFSCSTANPAAALYFATNSLRSWTGTTSSILSNSPPQRSSTILSRPKGPAPRLRNTSSEIGPQNVRSNARSAASLTPCSSIATPSCRASMMAWLAPLEPVGYMACAASPISATGPSCQVGTGSRSIMGFSQATSDRRRRSGTSSQSYVQSANWGAKSSPFTGRNQPALERPSSVSACTRAILPGRHRIAVNHWVCVGHVGSTQKVGYVEPVICPVGEMVGKVLDLHRAEPASAGASVILVDRHLGDPVDHGEAGQRVGMGD